MLMEARATAQFQARHVVDIVQIAYSPAGLLMRRGRPRFLCPSHSDVILWQPLFISFCVSDVGVCTAIFFGIA